MLTHSTLHNALYHWKFCVYFFHGDLFWSSKLGLGIKQTMCAVSRFPAIQSLLNKILNLPHHINPHSFCGFSTVYRHFNHAINIRETLYSSFALITNQIFSCKVTWQAPLSTSTGFEAKGSRKKAEALPFVPHKRL